MVVVTVRSADATPPPPQSLFIQVSHGGVEGVELVMRPGSGGSTVQVVVVFSSPSSPFQPISWQVPSDFDCWTVGNSCATTRSRTLPFSCGQQAPLVPHPIPSTHHTGGTTPTCTLPLSWLRMPFHSWMCVVQPQASTTLQYESLKLCPYSCADTRICARYA